MSMTEVLVNYVLVPFITFLFGGGLIQWLSWRRTSKKEDKTDHSTFCEEELTKYKEKTEELVLRTTQLEMMCIPSPVPEWRKDNRGFYKFVSNSYESVILTPLGLVREDVIGKSDYDIFPEDFANMLKSIDTEARRSYKNVAIRQNIIFPKNEDKMMVIKEITQDFEGKTYIIGRAYPQEIIKKQ